MDKILILASDPRRNLNLGREIDDLQDAIEGMNQQRQFDIKLRVAVRPDQLQELFLSHEPRIVHFCGHGAGEQGLVFEDDEGQEQKVSTEKLSNLFKIFQQNVECALLNACNTDHQAEAIVKYIDYVIGMSQEILDKAAHIFAVGFYRGLAYGKSIEQSYELGCNAIQIKLWTEKTSRAERSSKERKLEPIILSEQNPLPEHLKPVLRSKSTLPTASKQVTTFPPGFIEAIVQEVDRKQYKDGARETWDRFGQVLHSAHPSLTQHEYRQRGILLRKVKNFWLEGFLKKSLDADNAINLDLKTRPDEVLRPFQEREKLLGELDESFNELQKTKISNELGQGETLLLLGEPGAGKTIALLQLAQRLVERTERDLSLPIPVVFNLSSWAKQQKTIVEWLKEELREKYQVSKSLGETWIKKQQLILLLDGLDEVKEEHRNACVCSLNQFVEKHPSTYIAVCSRVKDYEALTDRLQLSSAICIQPISPKQVYQILEKAGDSLAGLKTLLQRDAKLEQFVQTPLILNTMISAYQGWSAEDLSPEFRSLEYRYQHLFDAYIERTLRRQGAFLYQKDKVLRWLNWLAKRMVQESQTVFLIENMQPSWLNSIEQKIYLIGSSLIVWTYVGGGVIFSLISLRLAEIGYANFSFFEIIFYVIVIVIFTFSRLIFGLFYGWGNGQIATNETIDFSWLSWTHLKNVITNSNLLAEERPISQKKIRYVKQNLWYFSKFIVVIGMTIAYLPLIIALRSKGALIENKKEPNQGICMTAINAGILGVISGLLSPLLLLSIGIFNHDFRNIYHEGNVSISICAGTIFVMIGFLIGGGTDCIRHISLRLILCFMSHAPWNYAHFLNYASDRLLMKKVGGGYIFYHRMLMEHFAQMNEQGAGSREQGAG